MAQISRLKDAEISNGNLINADDIDAEVNQLLNESNGQDTRLSAVESQDLTLDGIKTFLKVPKVDGLSERVSGSGVAVESVLMKNGTVQLDSEIAISSVDTGADEITTASAHALTTADPVMIKSDGTLPSPLSAATIYYARVVTTSVFTLHPTAGDATANTAKIDLTTAGTGNHTLHADPPSPAEGQLWYNQAEKKLKAYQNSAKKNVLLEGDASSIPSGYLHGPPVEFVSSASVKIPSGFLCRDKDDSLSIIFSADATVNIANSGANGLDTGSEASSTWYYLWAIGDSTETNSPAGLLSASSTAPTLPSGYDKSRLLPVAVRNDGSSNFLPFTIGRGWPYKPFIAHRDFENIAAYQVLGSGTAAAFTAVSLASLVPPISKMADIQANFGAVGGGVWTYIRPTGTGLTTGRLLGKGTTAYHQSNDISDCITDGSQSIDYKTGSNVTLHVSGYTVTEVN